MTHDHDHPNDRLSPWHILAGFGWGILACLLINLLGGCKSIRYVPVESHTTDTLYQVKVQRDSIHTTDSIYIHEWASVTGDTIYKEKERWRYLYRDRWRVDTLYKSHTDTISSSCSPCGSSARCATGNDQHRQRRHNLRHNPPARKHHPDAFGRLFCAKKLKSIKKLYI